MSIQKLLSFFLLLLLFLFLLRADLFYPSLLCLIFVVLSHFFTSYSCCTHTPRLGARRSSPIQMPYQNNVFCHELLVSFIQAIAHELSDLVFDPLIHNSGSLSDVLSPILAHQHVHATSWAHASTRARAHTHTHTHTHAHAHTHTHTHTHYHEYETTWARTHTRTHTYTHTHTQNQDYGLKTPWALGSSYYERW